MYKVASTHLRILFIWARPGFVAIWKQNKSIFLQLLVLFDWRYRAANLNIAELWRMRGMHLTCTSRAFTGNLSRFSLFAWNFQGFPLGPPISSQKRIDPQPTP